MAINVSWLASWGRKHSWGCHRAWGTSVTICSCDILRSCWHLVTQFDFAVENIVSRTPCCINVGQEFLIHLIFFFLHFLIKVFTWLRSPSHNYSISTTGDRKAETRPCFHVPLIRSLGPVPLRVEKSNFLRCVRLIGV